MSSKRGDPRLSRDYKRVRLQVLARDGYVCMYCGQDATTVDHVIPIVKGGDPISMDNMVAACRRCNSSKGSRSEGLFLQRQVTPPVFRDNISPTRSVRHEDTPFTARPIGN
jgi:5-methylcytosine-specific restriction endonuclease McrA